MALSPLLEKVKHHICAHFQLEEEKVVSMLPVFLTTLQNHMQNLEKALESKDPEIIGRQGHALKGALLNLGIDDMADTAHLIEVEGKSGNSKADFAGMVNHLKENLAEIL